MDAFSLFPSLPPPFFFEASLANRKDPLAHWRDSHCDSEGLKVKGSRRGGGDSLEFSPFLFPGKKPHPPLLRESPLCFSSFSHRELHPHRLLGGGGGALLRPRPPPQRALRVPRRRRPPVPRRLVHALRHQGGLPGRDGRGGRRLR